MALLAALAGSALGTLFEPVAAQRRHTWPTLPGGSAWGARPQAMADVEGMSGFRSLDWTQCVPFEWLGRSDCATDRIIDQGEDAPGDSVA